VRPYVRYITQYLKDLFENARHVRFVIGIMSVPPARIIV